MYRWSRTLIFWIQRRLRQAASSAVEDKLSFAELIVRAYKSQGTGFLQHLHGAFSIAIWDEGRQSLLLAIDRLGIRSLLWRQEGDRLCLGSRADAIRSVQRAPVSVNSRACSITCYSLQCLRRWPLMREQINCGRGHLSRLNPVCF